MAKSIPPPEDEQAVYTVMHKYCMAQDFRFNDQELKLIAATMFQHFEATGWRSGKNVIPFWPALAKRWLCNEVQRNPKRMPLFGKEKPTPVYATQKDNQTLKDKIRKKLERDRNESTS